MNKISLEKFREMNYEMLKMIVRSMNSKCITESEKYKNFEAYTKLLDELLTYDLSEIPFEEWKGLILYKNGVLDLSKTHANIDFSLLAYIKYTKINLKGCHVKNVQWIDYDEETFDPEYLKEHPEIYTWKYLPKELSARLGENKLNLMDLVRYPNLRKSVNSSLFEKGESSGVISALGFDNTLQLFDECPLFAVHLSLFKLKKEDYVDKTYEEMKNTLYGQVVAAIQDNPNLMLPIDAVPEKMKIAYPALFIQADELSKEVLEDYYRGTLTLKEIRKNYEVLKNKDLRIGIRNEDTVQTIHQMLGSFDNYLANVPEECDDALDEYFQYVYGSALVLDDKENPISDFSKIMQEVLTQWLKNSESRLSFNELYVFSNYLPLEKIFEHLTDRDFIEKYGFANLAYINQKYNGIFDIKATTSSFTFFDLLVLNDEFLEYKKEDFKEFNEQQIIKRFEKDLALLRRKDRDKLFQFSLEDRIKLSKAFPNEFIDFDKLNALNDSKEAKYECELEKAFNGDTYLLAKILEAHPDMVSIILNKDLIVGKEYYELNILYEKLGSQKFLEICSQYGTKLFGIHNNEKLTKFGPLMKESDEKIISTFSENKPKL